MNPHPTLPHRVERTRNRHSRAVLQGDTIVIRLARNLSATEEHEHISNLLRRMAKYVLQERERTLVDPFRPLLNGASRHTVQIGNGTSYDIELLSGTRTRAVRTGTGWKIYVGPALRRPKLHRLLWKLIANVEESRMDTLVRTINASTLRVRINDVRLSFARSQWGSCSYHGTIMLSSVLLFLPEALLHYVIVHELAHRLHHNHSRSYWQQVAHACPAYEEARRMLRTYRICSL